MLFQNYQHSFEKWYQNAKNTVLINKSRTALPAKILMPFWVSQTISTSMISANQFWFGLLFPLKVHCPIFPKSTFLFHLKNHHSTDVNLKFKLKRSGHFDVQAVLYISATYISCCASLIMVTITRKRNTSAVTFTMGYERNMSFSLYKIFERFFFFFVFVFVFVFVLFLN